MVNISEHQPEIPWCLTSEYISEYVSEYIYQNTNQRYNRV